MATYVTGRQRIITYTFTCSGTSSVAYGEQSPPYFGNNAKYEIVISSLETAGPNNQAIWEVLVGGDPGTVSDTSCTSPLAGTAFTASFYMQINSPFSFSGPSSYTDKHQDCTQTNYAGSATITVALTVEEVFDVNVGSFASYGAGGNAPVEAPYDTNLKFYERLANVQNNIVVTMTAGNGQKLQANISATPGIVISEAAQILNTVNATNENCNPQVTAQYQATSLTSPNNNVGPVQMLAKWDPNNLGVPTTYTSSSGATEVFDLTNGVSLNVTPGSQSPSQGVMNITVTLYPTVNAHIDGVVYQMDTLYQGAVQVDMAYQPYPSGTQVFLQTITGSAGSFSADTPSNLSGSNSYGVKYLIHQPQYLGPMAHLVTLSDMNWDTTGYLLAYLNQSWLSSQQEDTTDWRIGFKGRGFNSFTLLQNPNFVLDTCTSLTPSGGSWSAGPNLSLTVNNGIQIQASDLNQGPVNRSWSTEPFHPGSYRFLRIQISADTDALPFWVGIGNKIWATQVNNSLGYVELDLCSPTNALGQVDTDDTIWPLPSVDGEFWGVTDMPTLAFDGFIPGHTYTLQQISLQRHDHSRATFLPAFNHWVHRDNPYQNVDVRDRCVMADTDGKQSLTLTDFTRTIGTPTTYTIRLLSDLINDINIESGNPTPACPGWTATAQTSFPSDGYNNNSLPGCSAMGAGIRYTREGSDTSANWKIGIDLDASQSGSPLQVVGQALCDGVMSYPLAGDIFFYDQTVAPNAPAGLYANSTHLEAGKMLRGAAWGLAIQQNALPSANDTVNLTIANTSTSAGSGTTDSEGEYKTGMPYAIGQSSDTASVQFAQFTPPTLQAVTEVFYARKRQRICFRPAICCDSLFCLDPVYFPFSPKFGDEELLGIEEWRRVPVVLNNQEDRGK